MIESKNPSAIRSQKEITKTLISLMKKHPYNEITVKHILLESKLARKTFYRNFDSKDDVLYSLIKKTFREYFMIVNTAEGDVLTTIFSYVEKNQELLLLLDKNNMLYIPLQCMNEYGPFLRSTLLSERNPFNQLFEGLDSEYLMGLNIGAIWNVISLWIHRGMQESPDEIKTTIEQYLTRLKQTKV